MGKWTPDYLDDVLHNKIKNLVSGAITRSLLEKTDPTISYENFVKDLDTGDSFTTSLIDILVKELAERRTRPSINDRRLIADRSAKSLRLLATPLRIYRDRSVGRFHPRRSASLSEYLTAPPSEMDMEEDEDIFERMLDNGTTIEGARMNSELYEAYGNAGFRAFRPEASASPPAEEPPATASPRPPHDRSGPWSMPPPVNLTNTVTDLARQPSIRRPARSRTVDFNDFTHRRRSSIRDTLSSRADSNEITESRDGSDGLWSRNTQATRRFFPFSRTRRHEVSGSSPWFYVTEPVSPSFDDDRSPYSPPPNAERFTFTPLPQASSSQGANDPDTSDERVQISAPRLRRSSLRAAEAMLSRHASPIIIRSIVDSPPMSPSRDSGDHNASGDASYPTPGSTDNENTS